jgi:hypothetical protein
MLAGLFFLSYAGKYGTAVTQGGKAKITFRVLDNEQYPVAKARIQVGFYYDPEKQGIITGETDTNGLCTVEGITCMDMWYSIEKSEYYKTDGKYVFGQVEPPVINNHWQPWNPTNTTILKEVKNPVPMYVKSLKTQIPVIGEPVGFDLEKGDWVAPYGKGVTTDALFSYQTSHATKAEIYSQEDWSYQKKLTVFFPNKYDGIQKRNSEKSSAFWSIYSALENGYSDSYSWEQNRTPTKVLIDTATDDSEYFVFRVRTKVDEKGRVIDAKYGKFYGPIQYGLMGDDHRLILTYYFNPNSNDRNIEFDPEKNLFGGRDRFAP